MSARDPFELPPEAALRLERVGQEFLPEFLGRATRRHPGNVEALAELAGILTQLGRLEEGLAADESLAELVPGNATVHYNLACSQALLGRRGDALSSLERAETLGYSDAQHLREDEDLATLRGEVRFQALLERLERADGARAEE